MNCLLSSFSSTLLLSVACSTSYILGHRIFKFCGKSYHDYPYTSNLIYKCKIIFSGSQFYSFSLNKDTCSFSHNKDKIVKFCEQMDET